MVKRRMVGRGSPRAKRRKLRVPRRRPMARGFRRKFRRSMHLSSMIQPRKRVMKLKFMKQTSFAVGVSPSVGWNTFRANGAADPDATSADTVQPMGWTQLRSLYQHYRVLGAKITVNFLPNDKDMIVGVYLDDSSAPPTTFKSILEQKRTSFRTLLTTPQASTSRTVSFRYSARKFLGRAFADKDNRADLDSLPFEDVFFQVFAIGARVGEDPTGSAHIIVRIDYIVEFTEPITVGISNSTDIPN